MTETLRLKDQLVVVTGGLSGTGAAITEGLVKEGADVVALRRTERSEHTNRFLDKVSKYPGKVTPITADVTSKETYEILEDVVFESGKLFKGLVLAHAVGLQPELSEEYVNKVNNTSMINLVTDLLPLMSKGGKVMMLPSYWSYFYGVLPVPKSYYLVGRTKSEGEMRVENFFARKNPMIRATESKLALVVAGGIKGTAAWRELRNAEPEIVEQLRQQGWETTKSAVANRVVNLMADDFPSGHVEFVRN